MKLGSFLIVFFLLNQLFSQELDIIWMPGEVNLSSGEVLKRNLYINNKNFEGTLLIMEKDKIITHSPSHVDDFVIYDTLIGDTLIFESVRSKLFDRTGSKKIFLSCLQKGKNYSLYKNAIPRSHSSSPSSSLISVRYINDPYSEVYFGNQKSVLFISKGDIAYQVSIPKGKNPDQRNFKVEKSILLSLFGDQKSQVKFFIKQNKLNVNKIDDIMSLLDFSNSIK